MAYDFNGTNQYLSVATSPVSNVEITIAARFISDSSTTNQALCQINNSTASDRFLMAANLGTASTPFRAFVQNSSTTTAQADYNGLAVSTQYHGAVVFTSSTSRRAYLDGNASALSTATCALGTVDRFTIASRLLAAAQGLYVDGRISEFGIWDTSLNADEIVSLAKGFKCHRVRPQNLKFYAPLVRELIDVRGGVTITNNNTATVAVQPRVI